MVVDSYTGKLYISDMTIRNSQKLKALHEAIEKAEGQTALAAKLNQTPFAKRLGRKLKQQNINKWLTLGHIPYGWVLSVEEVTGISRQRLRPDVYPPQTSDGNA
jgi:DNA-binding transcriptional regulator YdaS (Cro superfamily)